MEIIDAHQHFWRFVPEEYPWITPELSVLRRDYTPEELSRQLEAGSVSGTILVEARGHLEETQRLVEYASRTSFVRGVIGWLPLLSAELERDLDRWAARLVGVRHAVGDESEEDFIHRPDFNRGVAAAGRRDLAYELSLWPTRLHQATDFADRHPNVRIVLDHAAKPYIKDQVMEPWASQIRDLSLRPNVYCKLSGLATEADPSRWRAQVPAYVDVLLEAFTPQRLLYGSDWPVCRLTTDYQSWLQAVQSWLSGLTGSEQSRIFSGTAREVYGF